MSLLVYNITSAASSDIRVLDGHFINRNPDGTSAIDPKRSHLNEHLIGNPAGLSASLKDLYDSGVKRPAKQAEAPYVSIVVSASAGYFRDDPDARGTWRDDRLADFKAAVMDQLKAEHGDDLIYAELHLDEDTPHIHAVIAPTYMKKPRKPGRKNRGETDEEFQARIDEALNSPGIRTVGRASNEKMSTKNSYDIFRKNMARALDHLGIEYGEDRKIKAHGLSTREWLKQQSYDLKAGLADVETAKLAINGQAARVSKSVQQIAKELREETLKRRDGKLVAKDADAIKAGFPEVKPVFNVAVEIVDQRDELMKKEQVLASERQAFEAEKADFQSERASLVVEKQSLNIEREAIKKERNILKALRKKLERLIPNVMNWLMSPDLTNQSRKDGLQLAAEAKSTIKETREETTGSDFDGPGF